MLLQIIQNTPKWVFFLFAALLWLGGRQLLAHRVKLGLQTGIAVGMTGLSLYGTVSAFPGLPLTLLAWLAGLGLALAAVLARGLPAGTEYDPDRHSFRLPGSAVPLALMMGIFCTKYAMGVALSLHPELAHDATLALLCGAVYGGFSGCFAGRAARLWRLALRADAAAVRWNASTPAA